MAESRPSISADPNQITKIEIRFIDDVWVEVRVYSDLYADPDVYDFPDKVSAIDFCRDVLRLRDG